MIFKGQVWLLCCPNVVFVSDKYMAFKSQIQDEKSNLEHNYAKLQKLQPVTVFSEPGDEFLNFLQKAAINAKRGRKNTDHYNRKINRKTSNL